MARSESEQPETGAARRWWRRPTPLVLFLAVLFLLWTNHGVSVTVPLVQGRNRRLTCQRNLKELGTLLTAYRQEHGALFDDHFGASVLLRFRCGSDEIRRGQETLFCCPGDPALSPATFPEAQDWFDTADWRDPAVAQSVCSYVVRDFVRFPLDPEDPSLQILACDRQGPDGRTPHHKDGIVVLYDDGSVVFLDTENLGLQAGDPIVVGPSSSHPELRKMLLPTPIPDPPWPYRPPLPESCIVDGSSLWPPLGVLLVAFIVLAVLTQIGVPPWRRREKARG